jgi:hypothetical protein
MSAKIDNTIQRHATRKEMARRWHLDFVWNDPEMRAIRDDPDVWHFVMMKDAELVVEAKLSENPEQRLAELRQGLGDKIIDQVSGMLEIPTTRAMTNDRRRSKIWCLARAGDQGRAVTCLCRCHTVRVLSLDGILDGTRRAIMRLFAFQ